MSNRELALKLLRAAGPRGVTTAEFLEAGVGSRYGARIAELRKEGHEIETERVREGSYRYTLAPSPTGDEPLVSSPPGGSSLFGTDAPGGRPAGPYEELWD